MTFLSASFKDPNPNCGWIGHNLSRPGSVVVGISPRTRSPLILLDRLAAAETQVIVFVAVQIHYPAAMPEGGSPAAPVFMGVYSIENEPAAFHFGIPQFFTAPTRHLAFIERKVHMFGGIPVLIVDS